MQNCVRCTHKWINGLACPKPWALAGGTWEAENNTSVQYHVPGYTFYLVYIIISWCLHYKLLFAREGTLLWERVFGTITTIWYPEIQDDVYMKVFPIFISLEMANDNEKCDTLFSISSSCESNTDTFNLSFSQCWTGHTAALKPFFFFKLIF